MLYNITTCYAFKLTFSLRMLCIFQYISGLVLVHMGVSELPPHPELKGTRLGVKKLQGVPTKMSFLKICTVWLAVK